MYIYDERLSDMYVCRARSAFSSSFLDALLEQWEMSVVVASSVCVCFFLLRAGKKKNGIPCVG